MSIPAFLDFPKLNPGGLHTAPATILEELLEKIKTIEIGKACPQTYSDLQSWKCLKCNYTKGLLKIDYNLRSTRYLIIHLYAPYKTCLRNYYTSYIKYHPIDLKTESLNEPSNLRIFGK